MVGSNQLKEGQMTIASELRGTQSTNSFKSLANTPAIEPLCQTASPWQEIHIKTRNCRKSKEHPMLPEKNMVSPGLWVPHLHVPLLLLSKTGEGF